MFSTKCKPFFIANNPDPMTWLYHILYAIPASVHIGLLSRSPVKSLADPMCPSSPWSHPRLTKAQNNLAWPPLWRSLGSIEEDKIIEPMKKLPPYAYKEYSCRLLPELFNFSFDLRGVENWEEACEITGRPLPDNIPVDMSYIPTEEVAAMEVYSSLECFSGLSSKPSKANT